MRQVHRAHSPAAEAAQDSVAAELLRHGRGCRVGWAGRGRCSCRPVESGVIACDQRAQFGGAGRKAFQHGPRFDGLAGRGAGRQFRFDQFGGHVARAAEVRVRIQIDLQHRPPAVLPLAAQVDFDHRDQRRPASRDGLPRQLAARLRHEPRRANRGKNRPAMLPAAASSGGRAAACAFAVAMKNTPSAVSGLCARFRWLDARTPDGPASGQSLRRLVSPIWKMSKPRKLSATPEKKSARLRRTLTVFANPDCVRTRCGPGPVPPRRGPGARRWPVPGPE